MRFFLPIEILLARARTSAPLTGLAVLAIRMMLWGRDMSYCSRPKRHEFQNLCTLLLKAWNITMKATHRCVDAYRDSYRRMDTFCLSISSSVGTFGMSRSSLSPKYRSPCVRMRKLFLSRAFFLACCTLSFAFRTASRAIHPRAKR